MVEMASRLAKIAYLEQLGKGYGAGPSCIRPRLQCIAYITGEGWEAFEVGILNIA